MGIVNVKRMVEENKYEDKAIRWLDKGDHYELIFTDDFITPSSTGAGRQGTMPMPFSAGNSLLTDVIMDMRDGMKNKEVHVFVGSFGGEVAALNMILQQLLSYEYRVGINLGTACSCGWMLLFACQERYVSTFSQAMYHDISSVCMGKHSELQRNAEFMGEWQKELLANTDTAKVLTPQELELGRTSEVWFTGRQLIQRGAAKDYREYLTREIPVPMPCFVNVRGEIYGNTTEGWVHMSRTKDKPVNYSDLVRMVNTPIMPGDLEQILKRSGITIEKLKTAKDKKPATAGKQGKNTKQEKTICAKNTQKHDQDKEPKE